MEETERNENQSQRGKATNSQRGMGEEPGDKGLWGRMETDREKQSDREGGRRERLLPWTLTLHAPLSPTVHPAPPQTGGDPEKSLGPSVCRAQLALSCPAGLDRSDKIESQDGRSRCTLIEPSNGFVF